MDKCDAETGGRVYCSEGDPHGAINDDSGDERKLAHTHSSPKPQDISVESSLGSGGSVCCSEGDAQDTFDDDSGDERKAHTHSSPKPQDISEKSSLGSGGSVCCSEGDSHDTLDDDSGNEKKGHTHSSPKPQDISVESSLGSGSSGCRRMSDGPSTVDDINDDDSEGSTQSGPKHQDISVEENIGDGLRSVTNSMAFGKISEINSTFIDEKFEKVDTMFERDICEIPAALQNCDQWRMFTGSLENEMTREFFVNNKIISGKPSSGKSVKRRQNKLRNKAPTLRDLNFISQKIFCGSVNTYVPFYRRNKIVDICMRRRKTAKNEFLKCSRSEHMCCYCNREKIADILCEDCYVAACRTCIASLHPACTPWHNHVVRPVDFRFRCRCHRELYKYFCTTCNTPMCENKMLQGHRDHVVESLTTYISTEREYLRKTAKAIGEFCLKKADLCLSEIEHQREVSELKWIQDKEKVQMEFASLRDMLVEQENVILRHMERCACSRKDRLHELERAYGDIIHQEAKLTSKTLQIITDPSKYNFLFKKGTTVKDKWAKLEDYTRALPCHSYPDTESYQQLPFSLLQEKDDIYRYLRAYTEELGDPKPVYKENEDLPLNDRFTPGFRTKPFIHHLSDAWKETGSTKDVAVSSYGHPFSLILPLLKTRHKASSLWKSCRRISWSKLLPVLEEKKDKQPGDEIATKTHVSAPILRQAENILITSVETTPAQKISSCGPMLFGKNTITSTVHAMSYSTQRISSAAKEQPTFGSKFTPSTKSFSNTQSTLEFKCTSETTLAGESEPTDGYNLSTVTKSAGKVKTNIESKGRQRTTLAGEEKRCDGYFATGTKSAGKGKTTLESKGNQRSTSAGEKKPSDGYFTTETKSASKVKPNIKSKGRQRTTLAGEEKCCDGYFTTETKSASTGKTNLESKGRQRTTSAGEGNPIDQCKFTTGTKSASKQRTNFRFSISSRTTSTLPSPRTNLTCESKPADQYNVNTGTKSTSKQQTPFGFQTHPRSSLPIENQRISVSKSNSQTTVPGTCTRKLKSDIDTQPLVPLNVSFGNKLSAETLSNGFFKVKPKQQTACVDSSKPIRTTDLWGPPSATLCRASHWEYTLEVREGAKTVLWNQQRSFREGDTILNWLNVFRLCPGKSYLLKVTPHYVMESSGDVFTGKPTRILIVVSGFEQIDLSDLSR